ncbi:MAG: hydantoinase/oxoprolinase family protein [Proteobacteria bacterium]|nr:hydantoinase/oxoprolinase family protein [Pseudomonadota bacterium]
MKYRIGIDVGGTFTDFLLMDEQGNSWTYKKPSTPRDPSIGVLEGLGAMAVDKELKLRDFIQDVGRIVHGTTVTTNAILTGKGAKTGLLTTKGQRDVLQMRRGIREELYNNRYQPPRPLVPRYLRCPVEERVDYRGEVVTPLQDGDVVEATEKFKRHGVQAVAVCFMHSYANDSHERRAAKIVSSHLPEVYLTISSEVLPQIRLYDRVSTTVSNSYVGPILRSYLNSLMGKLEDLKFRGIFLVMQSNGGVTSPEVAVRWAASTLLSGPAAGPIAGMAFSEIQGYSDCITIDMGGTSFDSALIRDRKPLVTTEGEINRMRIGLPMLQINTIGAGGGSIGWIDEGGLLRMGPQSAGADPGPVCYGRGGENPTCTDADLVLGYLNKDYFLGGEMRLDHRGARSAIEKVIGEPLGMDPDEAAAGMYQIINVNMASGIREVSVERGFDPRDFPLVVAGGAGPVHAGMIALELEIPVVIIPKESSIFCAAGMLMSDLRHDYVGSYHCLFSTVDMERLRSFFEEMESQGARLLKREGIEGEKMGFLRSLDIRYIGQYHEVRVNCTREEIADEDIDAIVQRFHRTHDRLYGYCLDATELELVNLRVTCVGETEKPELRGENYQGEDCSHLIKGKRRVYLPSLDKFREVEIYDGMNMAYGNRVKGPTVIEQDNTTVFVPPEYNVVCDRYGNYTMYLRSKESAVNARLGLA